MSTLSLQPVSFANAAGWSSVQSLTTGVHSSCVPFWFKSIALWAWVSVRCFGTSVAHSVVCASVRLDMFCTKFDGSSLEVVARKPDAKSVMPLLDFLPQLLSVTVLMLAASQAAMLGTMPLGTCLVTVVFLLQASSFSLVVKGVLMQLQDCIVSLVGLFVMILLNGCAAFLSAIYGDLCWASISSGLGRVDVSLRARSVVVTSGWLCCSDGARACVESDGSSGLCMLIAPSGESVVDVPLQVRTLRYLSRFCARICFWNGLCLSVP